MMGILSFPTSDVGKVYIIADILFNLMVFPQQPHLRTTHIYFTYFILMNTSIELILFSFAD